MRGTCARTSNAACSALLNTPPAAPLVPISAPVTSSQAAALIDARPLSPPAKRKIRRNGRVASLPKHVRDMVNRMLWNGVAYKNIVGAVGEFHYTLTERNISNWATGGYLEWRLEQDAVLQNRLDQDHLTDFLRRDGAPELPEVGLQAAATHLSRVLLQKLATAGDPESNLKNYSQMIDMLCRLNREISATQKQRDDSRRRLGPEYDPARINEDETLGVIEQEQYYSDPPSTSPLPKPAVPPFLHPIPTASFNAEENRREREDAELQRLKDRTAFLMAAFKAKPDAANNASQGSSPTSPAPAPAASQPAGKLAAPETPGPSRRTRSVGPGRSWKPLVGPGSHSPSAARKYP